MTLVTTAQKLMDAGFAPEGAPAGGMCACGDLFGLHRFVADFGSPLDGGRYYCQRYPECPCTGTWETAAPDEMKEQYRRQTGGTG